jgi:hypothetical protein
MISLSRRSILAFGLLAQVISVAAAEKAAIDNRVALKGYDPVSYFTEGQPQKGSADFSASFEDAIYWFKDSKHRAHFVADPARYAPQFDGWCAMSLTRGELVEMDPESWLIADGKLYVFGKKIGATLFAEQHANKVEVATRNWRELRKNP